MAIKTAAFAKHERDDLDTIGVVGGRATFHKKSRAKNGTVIDVTGYLETNASLLITAEGDTTTDTNLARQRETSCVLAIQSVVADSAEGKKLHQDLHGQGLEFPQDAGEPWVVSICEFFPDRMEYCPDVYEVDAKTGVVHERHDGHVMVTDPAAVTKMKAACK